MQELYKHVCLVCLWGLYIFCWLPSGMTSGPQLRGKTLSVVDYSAVGVIPLQNKLINLKELKVASCCGPRQALKKMYILEKLN